MRRALRGGGDGTSSGARVPPVSLGAVGAVVGVTPGRSDLAEETRVALEAQSEAPASIVVGPVASGIDQALAAGAEWVWLLDGLTVPQPDALAALAAGLDALADLPAPLLLASRVLDEGGALHPDAVPRHEIFEKQRTVDAIERGLVQLRAAPSGSVLHHRTAFERFGALPTDVAPDWAVFAFTARVLQSWEDTGFLVPASVAVRRVPPRAQGRRGGDLRARAGLLAGGSAWTTTERLWEGFLVAEEAVRAARGPARRA